MMTNNRNVVNNSKDHVVKNQPIAVWLAEGQSSQRDMLASLQRLKQQADSPFSVIASHRQNRPEIFAFADQVYREPSAKAKSDNFVELSFDDNTPKHIHLASANLAALSETLIPRWQFVLQNAKQQNVKVLLTGRNGSDYEAYRDKFAAAGIRLLTGATEVATLEMIDDKFAFMQHCHAHNIPVADAWRFDNVEQLKALLAEHDHQPLCVKPVTGIFAQGFWRLDTGKASAERYDSFEHLYFTEDKKIHTAQFINAYAHSQMITEQPIAMLLMPYLAGQEYSIDVVCEYGEVLAAVTRHKTGKIQHIGYDESVMAVVIPLIKAFGCDGIVSVQTKADDNGEHRVLEINSRPSGGIDYTVHSGIDLTQIGFAYWLGLTAKPNLADIAAQIIACQVRSVALTVKIEGDLPD